MTSKVLKAQEAVLLPVQVTVQALMIAGKQMTLAVFRQLPREPLIDYSTVTLQGIPWGYVNYHNKDCGCEKHLHIVWQRGNELCQYVYNPKSFIWEHTTAMEEAVKNVIVKQTLEEKWYPSDVNNKLIENWTGSIYWGGEKVRLSFRGNHFALEQLWRYSAKGLESWEREGNILSNRHYVVEDYEAVTSPIELLRNEADTKVKEWKAASQKLADINTEIAALPQLFIAV